MYHFTTNHLHEIGRNCISLYHLRTLFEYMIYNFSLIKNENGFFIQEMMH